ncbi:hypothetical protein FKM82_012697 [Ascaphus truei]
MPVLPDHALLCANVLLSLPPEPACEMLFALCCLPLAIPIPCVCVRIAASLCSCVRAGALCRVCLSAGARALYPVYVYGLQPVPPLCTDSRSRPDSGLIVLM